MASKPLTVGEILDNIRDRQLRESVYVHLVEYLRQFVSTDSYTPQKGIKSLAQTEDWVPEEVVDTVVVELEGVRAQIQTEINKLRGQRLPGAEERPKRRRP